MSADPLMPWPQSIWPPVDLKLHGEFVTIQPYSAGDGAELLGALDNDECWTHIPNRPSTEDEWNEEVRNAYSSGHRLPLVIRRSSDQSVIGTSSYYEPDPSNAGVCVGYTTFSPEVWGTPCTLETKLLMLGYAFEQLAMARVQLKTDNLNRRSQAAMRKWGATYEGTLRMHKRRSDRTLRDSAVFSVIEPDWPEVRLRLENLIGTHSIYNNP